MGAFVGEKNLENILIFITYGNISVLGKPDVHRHTDLYLSYHIRTSCGVKELRYKKGAGYEATGCNLDCSKAMISAELMWCRATVITQ
jgi:hypothetical protein